ncbi:MAG: hypothetical protein QXN68_00735 [Thermoplasmata archaeon]
MKIKVNFESGSVSISNKTFKVEGYIFEISDELWNYIKDDKRFQIVEEKSVDNKNQNIQRGRRKK